MRKIRRAVWGAALAVVLGVVMAPPASADVSSLTVTISSANSFAFRFNGDFRSDCQIASRLGETHYYTVEQLNVSVPGDYTYTDTRGTLDIGVAVYPLGGFDPADPSARCISSRDDGNAVFPLRLTSATSYTLVVTTYGSGLTGTGSFTLDGPGIATLGALPGESGPDLTIWQKAYGRHSADDACEADWSPSWMQWPHNGQGGYVCVKDTYAYYPERSVIG